MAQMIPDAMPPGKSMGERLVFARLQLLPNQCLVYYEPVVGDRYPDFVVIIPDCGLLVIEVKGWLPYQILGGDSHSIRTRLWPGEAEKVATNPIRQARDYMHKLMDACRRHPAGTFLLQPEGSHKGRFLFPFGFCAVLSQITDEELRAHATGDLRAILPADHVVAADEFDAWGSFSGAQLKERLASFFKPTWQFPPLTKDQIAAVRTIIHPEVLVPPTPTQLAEVAGVASQLLLATEGARATTLGLKALDTEQEGSARALGAGHRLLFGVAGSGKTIVLVARAKLLSQALPSGQILVLCFNVAFRSYLKALLEPCSNVRVFTFHGWGAHSGVPWGNETPEGYGQRLLAVLESGAGDAARYDAVLIDEAQDFDPSWFKCATLAMKEPRSGDLLIVGDRNQTSYQRRKVSWSSLGISARGRVKPLKENYRNTRPILVAAAPFADDEEDDDGIAAAGCDPAGARREGPMPVLLECRTREEELETIVSLVRDLLAGELVGEQIQPLRPSEIGLLYRKADRSVTLENLTARLRDLAPVVWLNQRATGVDPRQKVLEPGIKLQTIHSAKGLQYRAVILLFSDQLGASDGDLEQDRRLLYVALTRPEEVLAVTCATTNVGLTSPLLEGILGSKAFRRA